MSYSARIMNLPASPLVEGWASDERHNYKIGHSDARHAAAEIAAEADATIAELVAALEGAVRWFPGIPTLEKMGLDTAIPLRDIERARAALAAWKEANK